MASASLPDFEMDYKYFLDKSAVLIGRSGSHKSTMIQDILYCLRDHIDQIIVFSPTDPQNKGYEKYMVPLPCIHYTIEEAHLESIYERQKALAAVYNNANNINIIKNLFMKIPNIENAKLIVHKIIQKEKQYREELDGDDDQVREIMLESNKLLEKIYKQYVNENKKILLEMKLTDEERHTLTYMNLNPRIVIVFDDCTDRLNALKNTSIMKRLFFQGRHQYITFIIGLHTEKSMTPELKQSTFVTIFTTLIAAQAYIERPSNNINKEARIQALNLAKIAFNPSTPYQKLIWINDESKYYKYTAVRHPNFRFGSEHIWKFCSLVGNDGKTIVNNKFMSMF